MNLYRGKIVAIDPDEIKTGIIKCMVDGLYNSEDMGNIDEEFLPKVYPLYPFNQNNFDTPKIGEEVFILLDRGNKFKAFWIGKYVLSQDFISFISSRYEGFKSIKYDEEESLRCYFSRDKGLVLELEESRVNIKNNEIKLETPDRIVHIKDGMISLGSLERSSEPATLGDKNVNALTEISNQISLLCDQISTFCGAQSAITKNVSYLAPLSPAYDLLIQQCQTIKTLIESKIKQVDIPATLSSKTSLD